MSDVFKAACVQMNSGPDVEPNLDAAEAIIRRAAASGADFVLTPENTSIIESDRAEAFAKSFAEADHPGVERFAALARELGIWLLIGSMSVRAEGPRLANRSFLFDRKGSIVARYDKIHMFDVDLPNGETYRESKTMQPGTAAIAAATPWGTLGLSICYDLRFAYLYRALAQAGATMLSVPAAFTVPTGRAHWHILLRARAIETGCYVFAPAQCGTHAQGRQTYGHSLIVAPWGEIIAEAGETPDFIAAEIDMQKVSDARAMVPALRHDKDFLSPASAQRVGNHSATSLGQEHGRARAQA
jgi:predicted amidohydrolase